MSKRVFEFAKEIGATSKDILERCKKLGHNLPSQLTVMDEAIQHAVRRDMGLISDPPPTAAPKPAPATASPATPAVPAAPVARVGAVPPRVAPRYPQRPSGPVIRSVPAPGIRITPNSRSLQTPSANPGPAVSYPSIPKGGGRPQTKPGSVKRYETAPRRAPSGLKPPPVKGGHGLAVRPVVRTVEADKTVEDLMVKTDENIPKITIKVTDGITVSELAQKLLVRPAVLIKELYELKVMATINQRLDMTLVETLASVHNAIVEVAPVFGEEIMEHKPDDPKDLKPRPPVVTIMGHVDHGKTKLLDAIRSSNVAEGEAGGITQHIGAHQVKTTRGVITFLDTPGHEAFTAMRSRGAKGADIVVLVVAADDGVMPQTIEAIDHAKEAKVPILVALNKIDKPEANPDRVKGQLAERGLNPEEWGGKTIFVPVSAKKKQNIDKLLEMLLLEAEVLELKANPARAAYGVCLEARLDKGRGPVSTLLVENGTLKIGDVLVCGSAHGRVRAMHDDHGKGMKTAGPSMPVGMIGLSDVPQAGDQFYVVTDPKMAREISSRRADALKDNRSAVARHVTLDTLYDQIQEGKILELKVVLKGDVQGSVEAIAQQIEKLSTDKVALRVIHSGAGNVVNSDVLLADASDAIILGFNVKIDSQARELASKENVDIRFYTIIYELIDDVRKAMEGLLAPTYKEVPQGKAEIRQIFKTPKVTIAGCMVQSGKITNKSKVRLLRNGEVVYTGAVSSLKRFKDDVKEVGTNFECGIGLDNFTEIQVGDIVDAYGLEAVAQKL
jgi:translation initiation factor IF-2